MGNGLNLFPNDRGVLCFHGNPHRGIGIRPLDFETVGRGMNSISKLVWVNAAGLHRTSLCSLPQMGRCITISVTYDEAFWEISWVSGLGHMSSCKTFIGTCNNDVAALLN